MGFRGDSAIKNPPTMQETQVPSLDQEVLWEKEMQTYFSILAWEIPRTEEPGYSPWGGKESDMTEQLNNNNIVSYINIHFWKVKIFSS